MKWGSYARPAQHWKSRDSHGYFIVEEKDRHGKTTFVIYEGEFDDWHKAAAGKLIEKGRYATLEEAKRDRM